MKKITLIFFMLISFLQANIVLKDQPFRFDILNQIIHMPKDTMKFNDILKTIEVQTSYNVYNFVNEIPDNRLYADLQKFKRLGNLLNFLLSGYPALIKVEDAKYTISIVYPTEIYIDLPPNWDMVKTKQEFSRKFTYVKFYIAGNRLSAKGLKQDLVAVAKDFKAYQDKAFTKLNLNVEIYPYCTQTKDPIFLARRKAVGSEMYKSLYHFSTSVGQGDRIVIVYKKLHLNFTYDATRKIISNGELIIPINKLNDIGVAINAPVKVKTGMFSSKKCSHVIITFNKVNLLQF